ncbi:YjzD family protein [Bacillus alveayuensis]|jgi:Mg2+/Co2+ transporter CorB|uniref:Mg2+/Co2+ transporter CorB n=1 Tax=Aeribacillus alveayuensis TaxID=279215 RepID=A0ABT9VN72_9BACI|nr:YjzD family protein [Bacillus alveayuensis]MDQ0162426.1 Mg2+/Co2+ transporter CorB [Bacillus alveayuensis]
MRFIMTLFWAFLLVNMASYVISSMIGATYEFGTSSVLAVIATVLIFIIAELIPSDEAASHH